MISVVIPAHPPRAQSGMLGEALSSVWSQSLLPDEVHVIIDSEGKGAGNTRNRGLDAVKTEWVAFLDSDDVLLPNHLERCLEVVQSAEADLVYPWFEGEAGYIAGWFGAPFDPSALRKKNYIPITVVARTASIRSVGGFSDCYTAKGGAEDWLCWVAMLDAGAKFVHLPERTWVWRLHSGQTSGMPWTNAAAPKQGSGPETEGISGCSNI